MIVGILFAQAITFAVLSAIIASNKNRSPLGWGAIGFFFGLFGFVAAIAVSEGESYPRSSRRRGSTKRRSQSSESESSSEKKRQQSNGDDFDPDEHEKKCPMCAEYIKLEARVCKHCGHKFSEEQVEEKVEKKRKEVEGNQNDKNKGDKEVNIDNLERGEKYAMNTHKFIEENDDCERCGLSKSYIVNHKYKCPYSERG